MSGHSEILLPYCCSWRQRTMQIFMVHYVVWIRTNGRRVSRFHGKVRSIDSSTPSFKVALVGRLAVPDAGQGIGVVREIVLEFVGDFQAPPGKLFLQVDVVVDPRRLRW